MSKRIVMVLLAIVLVAAITGQALAETTVYQGLGKSVMFRKGPGRDSEGVQVYSINYVYATGLFDQEGRIISLYIDQLEVASPNYDGASMPKFPGWPGQPGYNLTDPETEKVVGVTNNTEEYVASLVNNWKTKRERGDNYGMNPEWYTQMDTYQEVFKGMTVDEVTKWYSKYCSDVNGRPLNPESSNEQDKAKLAKLTEKELDHLVDVRTGATMSLNDGHGNVILAIIDAFNNRKPVTIK